MALGTLNLHQDFKQASLASSALVGNTASFARGDQNASYFNSSGLLVFAGGNDTPRLQSYVGGANKGLLVEGSRKNVIINSQALDSLGGVGQWQTLGSTGVTVTANDAVAPDGNTTAELIENVDTSTIGLLRQSLGSSYGSDARYECSFFIKRVTTSGRMRVINPQAGSKGTFIVDFAALSDNWEWITRDHPALTTVVPWLSNGAAGGIHFDDNSFDEGPFDFHCWQVDNQTGPSGEAVLFPSMPILTGGAAVTRAAETCTIAHALSSAQGYTVVLQGRTPLGQGADDQVLWEHHDGAESDLYKVVREAADGHLHVLFYSGGAEVEDLDCGALADDTDFVLAFAAADGDFRASLDGGTVIDNGTLDDAPTGLTTVEVGHDSSDASHWFGHIAEARIYTGDADNGFLQDPFTIDITGTAAQGIQGPTQSGTGEESVAGTAAQLIPAVSQIATGFEPQTYYVDAGGDDDNSGISSLLPWKTVAKVNGAALGPGDTISFNKGDEWWETLIPPAAGEAGGPITFTAHGAGANPIVNSIDAFRYNHRDNAEYEVNGIGHNPTAGNAQNGLFIEHTGDDFDSWNELESGTTSSITYSEAEGFPMAVLFDGDGHAQLSQTWFLVQGQKYEVTIECKSDGVGEAFVRFFQASNGLANTKNGGVYDTWTGTELIGDLHIDAADTDWTTKTAIIQVDGSNHAVGPQIRTEVADGTVYIRKVRCRPLWTQYSGDIWMAAYEANQTGSIYMCAFDGVPTKVAADRDSVDGTTRWFLEDAGTVHDGILYVDSPGGDPGASSVDIDLTTKTTSFALDGNDKAYLTFDGIDFRNGYVTVGNFGADTTLRNTTISVGLYQTIVDADNFTLEDFIAEHGDWIINIGSCANPTIRRGTIRHAAKYNPSLAEGGGLAPSVVAGGDCTGLLAELLTIHDCEVYGLAEFGTDVNNRIEGAVYRRILIYDVWIAIWTQSLANGVSNSLIAYNIAHSPKASGDAVGGGSIDKSCGYLHYRAGNTVDLLNNLFHGFSSGIRLWNGTTALNAQNNLVAESLLYHFHSTDSGWTAANLNKNLYWSTSPAVWQYQGTTYNTLAEWQAAVEASAVGGDPLFVDAENGDFRVLAGSPALGAGADVGLSTDYLGNPVSGTPTIGPLELPAITASAAQTVAAPAQEATGAEHLAATAVQNLGAPTQAGAGSALLPAAGAGAQDLPAAAQVASGGETAAGTAAQETPAAVQVASGSETLAATAAQVLGGPAQAATGTAISDTAGAAAQDLGGPVQAADGAETFTGTAAQAISAPAQAAAGTSILDVSGAAAQALDGPAQDAAGGETATGAAGQSIDGPAQDAGGSFGGGVAGAAAQGLAGPSQAAGGTAILDVAGNGAQGIPAPAQAAGGGEIIGGASAQDIPQPAQDAAGGESTAGAGTQNIPASAQAGEGTAILDLAGAGAQSLAGPAQAGDGTETIGGAASGQTVASPRQAASGDETAGGTSAQIIAFPVQAGTGGENLGAVAALFLPAPVQGAVGVEITGDPRVLGTLSGSVGRTTLKGARGRPKLKGAA